MDTQALEAQGIVTSKDGEITINDDRIIGLERHPGYSLIPHPLNWRVHPQDQLALIKHSIQRFGISTALLGYYSERNNNKLTILDGHGRVEIDPNRVWPVLVTDLTDEEADTLLLLLDPISGLALPDAKNLLTLAAKSDSVDPVLSSFCMQLAESTLVKSKQENNGAWPTVKVSLPPDVYQLWLEIVGIYDGKVQDAFMSLLAAAGPIESPERDDEVMDE